MSSASFGISRGVTLAAVGLSAVGVALVQCGRPGVALVALVAASLASLRVAVCISGSWATLTTIFTTFHVVYGVAGPVAVLIGAPLPEVFGTPYHLDTYLVEYGLATLGLGLGLLVAASAGVIRPSAPASALRWPGNPRDGIIVIAIGSVFEAINFIRAGGWLVAIQGKAVYQSAVDALTLTLPSSGMISLGLALLALTMSRANGAGQRRISRGAAILLGVTLAPSMALTLALGNRAPLLQWLLVVVVGTFYHTPIRRLGWRMVGLAFSIYLASGLLYANRAIIGLGLVTGEWEAVWQVAQTRERLYLAVNPAATEFGAAFGNFSEYVARTNEPLRLGSSYLQSLTLPIPGFLYPGKKPKQIGMEFRDEYFAGLAQQGAIAGTAYSSLLEAYVNFGPAGGLGVYFLLGLLLTLAESARRTCIPVGWHLGYILLVSDAVAFHRSDFSLLVGDLALNVLLIVLYLSGSAARDWIRSGGAMQPGNPIPSSRLPR